MTDKIKLTLEDLGVLMQTAERNGTTHAWQAVAMASHPSPQRSASGVRSWGQSPGWTLAPSVTITPQPPLARLS